MVTTPLSSSPVSVLMPDPTVNVSLADPISLDIQAICKTLEVFCNFLCTPEGQLTVAAWRKDSVAWNLAIAKGVTWLQLFFAGKLT